MNHDLASVPCQKWSSLLDHLDDPIVQNAQLVILDEAQFFPDLYEFVRILVDIQKKKVLVVGLDGDIHRKPFGSILQCIPLADSITKLKAFCSLCGDGTEAIFSHRKKEIVSTEQIFVGGAEAYMPLCRKHYLEKETN
jgi:thymidine kinase